MHSKTSLDSIDIPMWRTLIQKSVVASVFQTPDFFLLHHSDEGMSADVFFVEHNSEYIASAVVQRHYKKGLLRPLTSRAIIHGGIVLHPKHAKRGLNHILHLINDYYKSSVVFIEQRNYFDYSHYTSLFAKQNYINIAWSNISLSLAGDSNALSLLSKSRQRQIKKALSSGITFGKAKSLQEFDDFLTLLTDLYTHKVKKPLPPIAFLYRLFESSLSTCILVKKNDEVIGGVLCLISESNKAIYEYYICGQDKLHPGCYPSVVAMWGMISEAESLGYNLVDLMGAGPSGSNSTVRDFKSKFGGNLHESGRFLNIKKPLIYKLGQLYYSLRR